MRLKGFLGRLSGKDRNLFTSLRIEIVCGFFEHGDEIS
jgi:hypothetical protein